MVVYSHGKSSSKLLETLTKKFYSYNIHNWGDRITKSAKFI